jgi:hypothetical protein
VRVIGPYKKGNATMRNGEAEKSTYKINASYRQQLFAGVISRDGDTRSWVWKGHIDFEDGPYREFTSRRNFSTSSEAEEHMRRFAHEQIDNWLSVTRPGIL